MTVGSAKVSSLRKSRNQHPYTLKIELSTSIIHKQNFSRIE